MICPKCDEFIRERFPWSVFLLGLVIGQLLATVADWLGRL